jgi:hypothetical protein
MHLSRDISRHDRPPVWHVLSSGQFGLTRGQEMSLQNWCEASVLRVMFPIAMRNAISMELDIACDGSRGSMRVFVQA